MTRIEPVVAEKANAEIGQLLDLVNKKLGLVPNVIATMANSEAAAKGYLGFSQALAGGSLSARLREQIALLVAEVNGCNYCLAAHCTLGKGVGLNDAEILNARRGNVSDTREQAALEFAMQVLEQRGMIKDGDLQQVRKAGYSDGEIMEIVANITLNILTNYVNLVAGTPIDFPAAPVLNAA